MTNLRPLAKILFFKGQFQFSQVNMTVARISGQYNDVLSQNLTFPAKLKLATEETIAVIIFKYIVPYIL